MARNNNEQRNIDINFNTNANQAADQVDHLSNSLNRSTQATDRQESSLNDLRGEVTSNGGAMAILDTITGGYATTVKDALEATGLFTSGTSASTIAQRAYATVVGTSTGAMKAFRIALAATGIGAFVVLLGLLIANWESLTGAMTSAEKAQKSVNDAMRAGTNAASAEASQLMTLVKIAKDETASKTARLNAIKAINAISPEYLGNITLETINTDAATVAIRNYVNALGQKMQVQALEKAIQKTYDDELEYRNKQAGDYLKWYDYVMNGWYDIDEAARNRQAEDIKDNNKTRESLNKQLEDTLKKSPELIFQETKKANDKIVTNTKTTNKQVQESDEDRHKKWMALQEEKEKTLERIKDLTIETAGQPSAVALNESQKKIATYYAQWSGLANGLANQLREGVLNVETFDSAIKDLDSSYETLIKNEENYQDDIQKRFGFVTSFIQDFENIVVVGGGNTSVYQALRADLIDLSNDLRGPVKEAFDTFYDIDKIREDFDSMSRFFDEVVTLDTDLKSFSDTEDGIVIQALFGKKSKEAINEKIEEVRNANEQILLIQESLALNIATTEEETERVREYYRDLRAQNDEEAANQSLQLITNTENQRRDIISASAQAQMSLIDAGLEYASEADRERIKSNGAYKAAMIGLTLIDTYASAMSAYKGMVAAIPGPWGIAAGVAAAVGSVATGLSNVKKIASVKIEGASNSAGAGAAASAGAAPNVSFVSSSENQIANSVTGAMNNQNQEPIKAYVVSSDVSSGQALERNKIESNSI